MKNATQPTTVDDDATVNDDASGGIRRMLTEEQICNLLKVSAVTLWRMERDGRFPRGHFISPNGKRWFVDQYIAWTHDVERQRHRRPPRGKGKNS